MILLDSDVLIDLFGKHPRTMEKLRRHADRGCPLATTSLNVAEVLRGLEAGSTPHEQALRLLSGLIEVPIGPRVARRYGDLMRRLDGLGLALPAIDGLVAAAALEEGAVLLTRNERHFGRVPSLQIEVL